jgi:hypothetical protein
MRSGAGSSTTNRPAVREIVWNAAAHNTAGRRSPNRLSRRSKSLAVESQPVFEMQSRDTAKLSHVMRRQDAAAGQSASRNQQVLSADPLASSFEVRANDA